ncbi:MAG: discoidin domain-containing protein, partial [Phycisphaeraceae bacterium]|nr:discoidin domain-containing protein [Phycisphaeraceae bacterium]
IMELDEWYHAGFTVIEGGDSDTLQMYVNGEPEGASGTRAMETCAGGYFIGSHKNLAAGSRWPGVVDDVRLYNRALTAEQIQKVMIGSAELAGAPAPANEQIDVVREAILSWEPGEFAATHDVYFGSSFEDVNDATVPISAGQDATSFNPGRLAFDQVYYWRVDEVNGTPDKTVFKGDIWSFTAEPYSIEIPGDTITVTASSRSNEFSTPEKTINGSGLDPNTGTHTIDPETMWFTGTVDLDPWIQFEFDAVNKLDVMTVWNSNGSAEMAIGWGVKDVTIEYSVDGENWDVLANANQFSRAPGSPTYNQPDEIAFDGVAAKFVRLDIQSNWGGILMSYGLSEVQFSMIPAQARTPAPTSGAADVLPNSTVTWRAGREADQHTIYMSTDMNAVAEGLAPSVSSSTNTVDLSSLSLELGQTYYWRVDEVNQAEAASVWPGPVWNLSTVAALTVDDFESYSNISPDRPFQTWLDGFGYSSDEFFPNGYAGNGTGAGIGHDIWSLSSPHYDGDIMETTSAIAGSSRSMPFYYSNSGGVTSQTQRTFATPQDWTAGGAQTLSIAFSGQAGNTGTLYVKINDTKITYGGDPENLTLGVWQAWNIDLSGMNVQNVTTLQIGVEGSGAAGMILIDDIKLHGKPGEVITPVDPGNAGLAGAWSFDEGSGTVAADSSGNGRTGTLFEAIWDTGVQGSALSFNDTGYVETGYAGITGTGARTCAAWIKTTEANRVFVSWGLNTAGKKWRMRLDATGGLRMEVNGGAHFGQT